MARKPRPGDRYRYTGETPLGVDAGALFPGTIVTVRDYVEADTPGAHDDREDAVVVEWTIPGIVLVDAPDVDELAPADRPAPAPAHGTVARAMSVGMEGRRFTRPGIADNGEAITVEDSIAGFHDLFTREEG